MVFFHALDVAIFRWVNLQWHSPVLDWLARMLSWNPFFVPALMALMVVMICLGGWNGRLFVVMLGLVLLIGDGLICANLKRSIGRPRPFVEIPEARLLVGKGRSGSMPSSHAANWFAAATLSWIYFRRRGLWVLGGAILVGASRVYAGVHYPSDVVAGAVVGILTAGVVMRGAEALWQSAGRRWFPLWWQRVPRLWPGGQEDGLKGAEISAAPERVAELQWRRLGWGILGGVLVWHWIFIAVGGLELSEDEAYQWLWSKHLALSYYSKPPLIAYAQFAGTSLWGDTEFGVRFFSPLLGALVGWMAFVFMERKAGARAATVVVLILLSIPLLTVGSTLMTIDALSVFFWTAGMFAGWKATTSGRTRDWVWTGIYIGLGFLSKYVAVVQLLCLGCWMGLWRPARAQWRRPGPYLALAIVFASALPVWIWNQQHHWITVTHLASRGGLDQPWRPSLRFVWDFWLAEAGLLNPIFFAAMMVAAAAGIRRRGREPVMDYLWWMGAPLFGFYALLAFRSRVQPNWVAPSVMPLVLLMVLYWRRRMEGEGRWTGRGLAAGLALGLAAFAILHSPRLAEKTVGGPFLSEKTPFARVLGWKKTAEAVAGARASLLKEGKPVFVIADHYGLTSLLTFYWDEAKARSVADPMIFCETSLEPKNQFYFWKGYLSKKGENAIFVMGHLSEKGVEGIRREFESVSDLGMSEIEARGKTMHRVHLFACRNLRVRE